jgi:pimeloyl-ACP methyl ester carboxylesterase
MEFQEFEMETNGFRYFYRVYKSEEERIHPIFFLGGAFQSMGSWEKFVTYFHDKTTVILMDLPGVGKADILPKDYGLDFLTECINHILKRLSISKVNVFSASYGSPIGYEFAKRYPHQVSHLLLGGIMREIPKESEANVYRTIEFLKQNEIGKFSDEVINGLLCMDPKKEIKKGRVVARLFRNQLLNLTSDQIDRYISNSLRLFLHTPLNIDHSPDVPTLVFTGEHDTFTKPEYCKEIAQSFKNAIYTTIKDADHLCHMEQFDSVIELSSKFFFDESLDGINGCGNIEFVNNKSLSKERAGFLWKSTS